MTAGTSREPVLAIRGLNVEFALLARTVRAAEGDEEAAKGFGTNVAELTLPLRDIELRNWLDHVKARAAKVAA